MSPGIAVQSSRPASDWRVDVCITLIYAAVIFVLYWGVRFFVIMPLGKRVLREEAARSQALTKYTRCLMELIYHAIYLAMCLLIVPRQPWIWPSENWWIGFAEESKPHALMRDDLRCYYLLYAARYVQALVTVCLEPKRSDFIVMIIHHAVTLTVVAISYWCGWNRIGCIVMLIFDPADVFVGWGKLCLYTGHIGNNAPILTPSGWKWCADRAFEAFAVVFFVTRLVMHPYVCWSAHVEASRYFAKDAASWTCVACLEVLLALQIYWFRLIVEAILRKAKTGELSDHRE